MKNLILGRGRFAGMKHKVVAMSQKQGGGNAGHGGYVKKDLSDEGKGSVGAGQPLAKRKLTPLKFKM